jgi:hypothetical protein
MHYKEDRQGRTGFVPKKVANLECCWRPTVAFNLLLLASPLLIVSLLLLCPTVVGLSMLLHLFFVATVLLLAEIPADAACYCWYLRAVVFVSGIYIK